MSWPRRFAIGALAVVVAAAVIARLGCRERPAGPLEPGPGPAPWSAEVASVDLGTRRDVLVLEPQPSDRGALASARVVAAAESIDAVEVVARLAEPLTRSTARPGLIVGLDGQRLVADELQREGPKRRYRAIVPDGRPAAGELSVWAGDPLREAGIVIEQVELVRFDAVGLDSVSLDSGGIDEGGLEVAPSFRLVGSGLEARFARLVGVGERAHFALSARSTHQRVRLAWLPLGPPRRVGALEVEITGHRGRRTWRGVTSAVRGWSQVEIGLAEVGAGAVGIGVEVFGEVGIALVEPRLVPPEPDPARPSLIVVVIEHLPAAALEVDGPMPGVGALLQDWSRLEFRRGSVEAAAEVASLLGAGSSLAHRVGLGDRAQDRLLLTTRLRALGYATVAAAEAGVVVASTGLDAGFDVVSRFPGGWPRHAAERMAEELALMLVDDPTEPLFLLAHLAGTAPPWPRPDGVGVRRSERRVGPHWQVSRVLETGQGRGLREVDHAEAAVLELGVAARLDDAVLLVLGAAAQGAAAARIVLVALSVGDGNSGAVALSPQLAAEATAEGMRAEDLASLLARVTGLTQATDPPIPIESPDLVESLLFNGRVEAKARDGRRGWVELAPWGRVAPSRGGDFELAELALAAARSGLSGTRLRVAAGRRFALRGVLSAESVFVVDGEVRGELDPRRGIANFEVLAGNQGAYAELVLGPRMAGPGGSELLLELAELTLPLRQASATSGWVLEAREDGTLAQRGNAANGPFVAELRPSQQPDR